MCIHDELALIPAGQDTDRGDDLHSAVELFDVVTVSASLDAPVTLPSRCGGDPDQAPADAVAVHAADVDGSDNQDGFAVVLTASGGGLPITGPQARLTAGIGLVLRSAVVCCWGSPGGGPCGRPPDDAQPPA